MMILDTSQEFDELYSIYKSLLDKEIKYMDMLLVEEDLITMKEIAKDIYMYSEQASTVAKAVMDIIMDIQE